MSEPTLETPEILRSEGWHNNKPWCDGCQSYTDAIVRLGEDDYDHPRICRLCLPCIDKARALLVPGQATSADRKE